VPDADAGGEAYSNRTVIGSDTYLGASDEAIWWFGLFGLVGGCVATSCPVVLYLGNAVEVTLVDEHGAPASARGEVRVTRSQSLWTLPFDCQAGITADLNDLDCNNGVLTLEPLYNPDDTIDVVFKLGDDSWLEPFRVKLTVKSRVVHEGDCEQTVYDGTAESVVVPAEARLDQG